MGTNLYIAVLAIVFTIALLAGSYHAIPPWVVWLGGLGLAVFVGLCALIILGKRILRGDFDPNRKPGDC